MEQHNYTVTQYASIKKPQVIKTIAIDEVFQTIKNGDSNLPIIQKAREFGKGNPEYGNIKEYDLPTYRFSYQYKDYAINDNITAPTGLLYLDVDSADTIPHCDYIFAYWRSLSATGYGILVKIDNLTVANHKDAYNQLSEVIGIKSDPQAGKPIQQTVLSYDSNLYHNPNSLIYSYVEKEELKEKEEIKKVSFKNIKKRKEGILTKEPFLYLDEDAEVAFRKNNIDDYFKGEYEDEPYRVFSEEKEMICQPFIPFKSIIKEGNRNNAMSAFLSSYAALNIYGGKEFLIEMSYDLNCRMNPKLPKYEVETIIRNILKRRSEGKLVMYLNKGRRILFNPNFIIPLNEMRKIIGRENGKIRRDKTESKIYHILEDWDFEAYGKITQEKVAKVAKKSKTTIKRYWELFKDYVGDLNAKFKHDSSP